MDTSRNTQAGFAVVAIIGGTAVAVALGGVFYFLRGRSVDVETAPKEDTADILDESALSVEADRALIRGLPRGRDNDYCMLLGLERDVCADGVENACRNILNNCGLDTRDDPPDTLRRLAEACLVLGNAVGRSAYFAWFDSGDPEPFPLYYAIFGLNRDSFNQKDLTDAYQSRTAAYRATLLCDNREIARLLAESFLVLNNPKGRERYNEWLDGGGGDVFSLYYAVLEQEKSAGQEEVADAYTKAANRYDRGYYGVNPAVLRTLTNAFMVLSTTTGADSIRPRA